MYEESLSQTIFFTGKNEYSINTSQIGDLYEVGVFSNLRGTGFYGDLRSMVLATPDKKTALNLHKKVFEIMVESRGNASIIRQNLLDLRFQH